MVRLFLLFAGIFFLIEATLAQRNVKDSLISLLDSTPRGEQRVDILNELSFQFYDFNDSIGYFYANQALTEATQIKYLKGIKYAYTLKGIGYSSNADYKKAVASFKKSKSIHAQGTDGIETYNLTLLGNVYRERAQFDSAFLFYGEALQTVGPTEPFRKATLYKNYAILYAKLWQNEKAIAYLDSATVILKDSPEVYTELDVLSTYGRVYQNLLQFDESQKYFNEMCLAADSLEDYFHKIKCVHNTSLLAYKNGDFPKALKFAFEALNYLDKYKYPPQQVEVLTGVGDIYIELSEYDLANKYFFQALKIAEQGGFIFETAHIYSRIAWTYTYQRNYPLALEYINKSQIILKVIGDKYGISSNHNLRGIIFYYQKKYQESIAEHELAKQIRVEIKHIEGVAASIFNISLVYVDLNQTDRAISLQKEAISVAEKIGNKRNIIDSYNHVAGLLISQKKIKEGEHYLERARVLANETRSKLMLRDNAGHFATLHEVKGDYKRALEFRKLYQSLNDSIYSEASAGKLAEMQALYQVEKKDQEIELLNKESQLQESQLQVQQAKLRQQRLLIIAGTVALLLISVVAYTTYFYYRKIHKLNIEINEQNEEIQAQAEELSESNVVLTKLNNEIVEKNEEIQAQSEELIEANQTIAQINRGLEYKVEERTTELKQAYKELDTFFYRSSHDFRRPLTTFMGLAEVAKITVKDQNALELFSKVNDTAHYLDKMLIKLQSISDVGGQELVYKEVFLKEIFDTVCDTFREDLQRKGIKTICEIELKESFYSYPALLRIIIENLIENSIFFSRMEDASVKLKAFRKGGDVILEISDNGEGIPPEYHDRVFEMYFRANERSKGNGLGLYIVSKAIEKLGGTIFMKSEIHQGSVFTITFPDQKS